MKCLNEYISRRANAEEQCTGHFWEGRFKSQALLDEAALMSCMAYVDLNPIRAKMASTPEQSDYTSIQARIKGLIKQAKGNTTHAEWLLPMIGQANDGDGIPLDLDNYLALVDWTGRAEHLNKRGSIPNHLAPILSRLALSESSWLQSQNQFGMRYCLAVGSTERVKAFATRVGRKWLSGQGKGRQYGFG